jgi:hypothetical protein
MDHGNNYMCTHLHYSWLKGVQYYRDCNSFYRIMCDALVAIARFDTRSLSSCTVPTCLKRIVWPSVLAAEVA